MTTSTVIDPRLLSLLHFGDSAFPTGGYAHSFGLETYCQAGLVRGREDLERFLVAQLEGASGPCDATAAVGARAAAASGDLERCRVIDGMLEAMKPVTEFREASRQMGRQTLRVGAALTEEARLVAYAGDVEKSLAPGHHAVAFGLAAAALGWTPDAAATSFLYSSTALLVGAALRLLPMGQLEGQRVLWGLHPVIQRVASDAVARDVRDLWSFAPGIELAGIRHASLDMRLFRS
ncbi:MAG TPA: urease accessory UreF family protein [Candidatus Bathyarchaeia archaeon]|nr:urease accessory UreF family protein [Candidatus Bathyarchaeia archaeon]